MAQTRKKRRRKHRGTQGGSLDRRGPRGRPRTREEAKARARTRGSAKSKGSRRPVDRRDIPPTWSGAFKRGLIGAGIFFLLFWLAFQRPLAGALLLSLVMLALYVPMGYYIDRFMYQRRVRQLQAARAKKQQG